MSSALQGREITARTRYRTDARSASSPNRDTQNGLRSHLRSATQARALQEQGGEPSSGPTWDNIRPHQVSKRVLDLLSSHSGRTTPADSSTSLVRIEVLSQLSISHAGPTSDSS